MYRIIRTRQNLTNIIVLGRFNMICYNFFVGIGGFRLWFGFFRAVCQVVKLEPIRQRGKQPEEAKRFGTTFLTNKLYCKRALMMSCE